MSSPDKTGPVSRKQLSFSLVPEHRRIKGFTATQWQIHDLTPGDTGPHVLALQLFMTERAAYRFNLGSLTPRLFVRAGFSGQAPEPTALTASQEVAASWMDGEQQVFDVAMPAAIQLWLEAYLAHHGEAPVEGRKKKRKGAGRAREDQA